VACLHAEAMPAPATSLGRTTTTQDLDEARVRAESPA
jgi:hypothetical protein